MDWLVIEGVRPWDGRYEFDINDSAPLTIREWGWIKRFSGYLPLTVDDGYRGYDPELYATFGICALHRAGRIQPDDAQDVFERFADTAYAAKTIRLEIDPSGLQDGDAGPPAGRSGSRRNGSGDSSTTNSGMWAPPDGTPDSATSESPQVGSPT